LARITRCVNGQDLRKCSNGGNTLTLSGTGSFNFDNTSSIISGAGGITMNAGRLVLGGGGTTPAHTYSGDTNLNGGVTMFNLHFARNWSLMKEALPSRFVC
jgi:hypothetical protein